MPIAPVSHIHGNDRAVTFDRLAAREWPVVLGNRDDSTRAVAGALDVNPGSVGVWDDARASVSFMRAPWNGR
jgi:hypothetical protein